MKDISVRGNQHIIIVTAVLHFHLVTDKFSFSNFFGIPDNASKRTHGRLPEERKQLFLP